MKYNKIDPWPQNKSFKSQLLSYDNIKGYKNIMVSKTDTKVFPSSQIGVWGMGKGVISFSASFHLLPTGAIEKPRKPYKK
jgi:hypothetical protein